MEQKEIENVIFRALNWASEATDDPKEMAELASRYLNYRHEKFVNEFQMPDGATLPRTWWEWQKKITEKKTRKKLNMNILINLSNHPSNNWSDAQKAGWDDIIDLVFPQIPANISEIEVGDKYVIPFIQKLENWAKGLKKKGSELNIMLQGEFTFCYLLRDCLSGKWNFYIPTTERKVIEKHKEDGSVEKTAVFQFVRWRKI